MEDRYTVVKARRGSVPDQPECEAGDHHILVNLTFYKTVGRRASTECPLSWDSHTVLGQHSFWIDLPESKKDPSPYRSICTRTITEFLSSQNMMNIPENEQVLAIDKLFFLLDDSVSPDPPINMGIHDVTVHVESYTPDSVAAAATRESIEDLERVSLDQLQPAAGDSCAICWLDYDHREEQPAIRLPCSHYFHGDCILRWLQINHVCPMCRFTMPTQRSS